MKVIGIVKYIVTLIGIFMLVNAFLTYKSTHRLLAGANIVEGTVVALEKYQSKETTAYRPVVHFINQSGQIIEFTSSHGSNPPNYLKGQKVEVLYLPTEPQNAKLNNFFSIWGDSIIFSGFGVVICLIGTSLIIANILKSRKEEYLMANSSDEGRFYFFVGSDLIGLLQTIGIMKQ